MIFFLKNIISFNSFFETTFSGFGFGIRSSFKQMIPNFANGLLSIIFFLPIKFSICLLTDEGSA
jgi:hypothetical protein